MTLSSLLNIIKKKNLAVDLDLVQLAYDFADRAHEGQKRLSGEPYITHPLATAAYLVELGLDQPTIIAGLLHDVPEETKVTLSKIEKEFGREVAQLVSGVTKLGKIKYRGVERYLENLRRMFVAMAQDVRVILIKFADRLHNLETLSYLPPEKQARIACESIEIYAPIANRLGMGDLKGRLEDLAFPYMHPEEYRWVQHHAASRVVAQEKYLERVIKLLWQELKKEDIVPESIHGREKHLYSLYQKLMRYDMDIDKIYDLVAIRIIVRDIPTCYATLGVIHKLFRPLKGRIKDYIAMPKPNGYRSLHTTVFCVDGRIVEFQIRDLKMHERAEFGIAAHWHYKEKGGLKQVAPDLEWLSHLIRWQKKGINNKELLENLKLDFFQNRIFVFTPKGDVIDLPENSTPVDFAYHIHSDLGNRCTMAKINEQIARLSAQLRSGDICEIIIDKRKTRPAPEWLKFVKTTTAREQIKRALKRTR